MLSKARDSEANSAPNVTATDVAADSAGNVVADPREMAQEQGNNRRLGGFAVAALLVSGHYGMGFLLGTAESSATWGMAGSVYPVALVAGTLLLWPVARLYWHDVAQLWNLLGDRYGRFLKQLSSAMSWLSFAGVMAAQVAAGAAIVSTLGLPKFWATAALTVVLGVLSLLPLHRLSWVVRGLLLVSLVALVTALVQLDGVTYYVNAPVTFSRELGNSASWGEALGIFLTATITVPIDMKAQQFVVQGRSPRAVSWGCIIAAAVVLMLAFVPSAAVVAAQQSGILPEAIAAREIIPYVLGWLGGGVDQPLGIALVGTLLLPALGAGSAVLRVQTQLTTDALPKRLVGEGARRIFSREVIRVLSAGLALMLAFKGGSIIGLMVAFYAVYGAAVFWPFLAYIADRVDLVKFSPLPVQLSAGMSAVASLAALVMTQLNPAIALANSAELTVLLFGIGFGLVALLAGQAIALWLPGTRQAQT
ncbi:MAG: hypothetical protein AAF889_07820 [Cyanobacteria bacterium P01_D01_bin.73]